MTFNLAYMIDEVREHVGLSASDPRFTDERVTGDLNRSYIEVNDKLPFSVKESFTIINTVADTEQYDLGAYNEAGVDSIDSIRYISIYDEANEKKHTRLVRLSEAEMEDKFSFSNTGKPEYYALYAPVDKGEIQLQLYPVPDGVYAVRVGYNINLIKLSESVSAQELEFPDVWVEIIIYGAVWRAFLRLGDSQRVNEFRNIQIGLINSTTTQKEKETVDSRMAGVYAIRPPYNL